VVDTIERAVIPPQIEIIVHRTTRRQVFRDRSPLASRAQDVHHPVHHLAQIDRAFVTTGLGRRDQWRNQRPLIVGQIARISQSAAVMPTYRIAQVGSLGPTAEVSRIAFGQITTLSTTEISQVELVSRSGLLRAAFAARA
jgi:hypothetical protein